MLLILVATGCSGEGSPSGPTAEARPGQPLYAATSSATDTSTTIAVTATNPEPHAIRFTLRQPCTIVVRVHESADLNTPPVWDQEQLPGGCKSFELDVTLEAGQSTTWTTTLQSASVLAGQPAPQPHPLPPGRYFFEALVVQHEPGPVTLHLPAGDAELR